MKGIEIAFTLSMGNKLPLDSLYFSMLSGSAGVASRAKNTEEEIMLTALEMQEKTYPSSRGLTLMSFMYSPEPATGRSPFDTPSPVPGRVGKPVDTKFLSGTMGLGSWFEAGPLDLVGSGSRIVTGAGMIRRDQTYDTGTGEGSRRGRRRYELVPR